MIDATVQFPGWRTHVLMGRSLGVLVGQGHPVLKNMSQLGWLIIPNINGEIKLMATKAPSSFVFRQHSEKLVWKHPQKMHGRKTADKVWQSGVDAKRTKKTQKHACTMLNMTSEFSWFLQSHMVWPVLGLFAPNEPIWIILPCWALEKPRPKHRSIGRGLAANPTDRGWSSRMLQICP